MTTSITRKAAPQSPTPVKTAAKKSKGNSAVPTVDNPADASKATRVRGTFVLPEADYALIAKLKLTAKRNGIKVKKSELLGLGLRAVHSLPALELKDRILSLRVPGKRSKK